MPVRLTRLSSGKVRVSTPSGTKSKATSIKKALAQKRIIEQDIVLLTIEKTTVPDPKRRAHVQATMRPGDAAAKPATPPPRTPAPASPTEAPGSRSAIEARANQMLLRAAKAKAGD